MEGSKAVSTLDSLLADMETFQTSPSRPSSRRVGVQVDNKKADLEERLESLTDKLVDALKVGTDISSPEEATEKGDLGKCVTCSLEIVDQAVLAGGNTYHSSCFTCHHCRRLLADTFFVVNGNNYCAEHQAVALDPCSACEQPIKDSSVLVNQRPYHPACFACSSCNTPIGGKFYNQPDGSFLCEQDYLQSRDKCSHCSLPLVDRVLTAVERKFHPSCFRCALCDAALEGLPFLTSGGTVNCQPCYARYKAAQCVRCHAGIVNTGDRKTSLVTCQGRSYHEDCYTCGDCQASLTGQYVCAAGEEIVCFTCDTRRRS